MKIPASSTSTISLRDFLESHWLPIAQGTVRPSTIASYRGHVRCHLVPHLGGRRLRDITPLELNSFYQTLLGAGLSSATVRRVHATLRRALGDAVRWGLLSHNAAADADPPKDRAQGFQEMRTWTAEELRGFLAYVAADDLRPLWFLLAMTGLRRGEGLGLRWQDLDLDASQLAVRQTFVTVGYDVVQSRPKTARGHRVVALDDETLDVLRVHREQVDSHPSALLFSRNGGEPLHPVLVSKRFNRLVRGSSLPRIRLHDLRHTHATLALRVGIHPKIVSERLGHSTVALTLDVYSHSNPHLQAAAAESIRNVIFPSTGDESDAGHRASSSKEGHARPAHGA